MANKKISELDQLTSLEGADLLPIVDISETNLSIKTKAVALSTISSQVIDDLMVDDASPSDGGVVVHDSGENRLKVNNSAIIDNVGVHRLSIADSEITGIDAELLTIGGAVVRLIDAGLESINQIINKLDGTEFTLVNETTVDITLIHDAGTIPNRRLDLGGVDYVLRNGDALKLQYNSGISRWTIIGKADFLNVNTNLTPKENGTQSIGDTDKAWSSIFLKDTLTSQVYKLEITDGVFQITAVP